MVSRAEGERIAAEWRVPFCESSAKANSDATIVFEAMVAQVERSNNNQPYEPPAGQAERNSSSRCSIS